MQGNDNVVIRQALVGKSNSVHLKHTTKGLMCKDVSSINYNNLPGRPVLNRSYKNLKDHPNTVRITKKQRQTIFRLRCARRSLAVNNNVPPEQEKPSKYRCIRLDKKLSRVNRRVFDSTHLDTSTTYVIGNRKSLFENDRYVRPLRTIF